MNPKESFSLKTHRTKRDRPTVTLTARSNRRGVREQLARKVCGGHMGLWLLLPEYRRLGVWEMLTETFGSHSHPVAGQLALQMVNESALCVGRLRRKDSLCHQGFSLAAGLSVLATDESVHDLLDGARMADYQRLQRRLLAQRALDGHYSDSQRVLVLDPHRMNSSTRRIMPAKKKNPGKPARKMLQSFFCNDAATGQPLGFDLSASGATCSKATLGLLRMIQQAGIDRALVLADKEHFTRKISEYFYHHPGLDVLMPAPASRRIKRLEESLNYQRCWAGYAVGEAPFSWKDSTVPLRLLGQREGENPSDYCYKAFLTTSRRDATELLSEVYPNRWSIEEFFNFEGAMGWNRASTFNLNIRYGRGTLALLAQAATYRLRKNLPGRFKNWSAQTLAGKVLSNMEGDLRVAGDSIIVTFYRDHQPLGLAEHYSHISTQLESEGINPKIPWLMDYKLKFRFK